MGPIIGLRDIAPYTNLIMQCCLHNLMRIKGRPQADGLKVDVPGQMEPCLITKKKYIYMCVCVCDVQNVFSISGKEVSKPTINAAHTFYQFIHWCYLVRMQEQLFCKALCWLIWGACLLWQFANVLPRALLYATRNALYFVFCWHSWPAGSRSVSNWSSSLNLSISCRTVLWCGTWDSGNTSSNFYLTSSVYLPPQRNTCSHYQYLSLHVHRNFFNHPV
jgi:hypothetical protein